MATEVMDYENLPKKKKKRRVRVPKFGVGMPAALWLNEFGSQVWSAFDEVPYLVGSAIYEKTWRDVDVRVLLSDKEYKRMGLGDPDDPHRNGKWVALCLAFSALGKKMTGLPIDFQIQQTTYANKRFPLTKTSGIRSALGLVQLRMKEPKRP
jgi:hypothetical protein